VRLAVLLKSLGEFIFAFSMQAFLERAGCFVGAPRLANRQDHEKNLPDLKTLHGVGFTQEN
jgi:hypothetical protein